MKASLYYLSGKQTLFCFPVENLFKKLTSSQLRCICIACMLLLLIPHASIAGDYSKTLKTAMMQQGLPCISINDISMKEGNSGSSVAKFEVTLNKSCNQTVIVKYWSMQSPSLMAATDPKDFTGVNGSLTFSPGETSKTIDVVIKGDKTYEENQEFFINLSGARNATICKDKGKGIIEDDDPLPEMKIRDTVITEGNSGQKNAYFMVEMNDCSDHPITFEYEVSDGTAKGDEDFVPKKGRVTIDPTKTYKWVIIPIKGDESMEDDEDFFVTISNAVNAQIIRDRAKGTIVNDDEIAELPSITIGNTGANEADGKATFTLSLSAPSTSAVTVDYATADNTATEGSDYTASSGTITFPAGETSMTFDVAITDDTETENTETFFVNLSNATNATINTAQGQGSIFDNDEEVELPNISFIETSFNEEVGDASIDVSLNKSSTESITVEYATAAGSAMSGTDFTAASGTITFAPGETSKTIIVAITNDGLDENNENFVINFSNPTNANLPNNQGSYTILDDDGAPTVSILDASANEGDGTISFIVQFNGETDQEVTVDYATANSSATAGADYTETSGTISFPAGSSNTTKTFTVPILEDEIDENAESFLINLTNPVNATIVNAQGEGFINDNDETPAITINNNVAVAEGNSGTVAATLTVSLSPVSSETITVDWATQDNTATNPADYEPDNGTLTFAPGESSKTITLTVNGDELEESNESFSVNLSNATGGATISDTQGFVTITDDDAPLPTVSIGDVTVTEGNSGTVNAVFTVTLNTAAAESITVDWATQDNSAAEPGDYTSGDGTLTFAAGETSKTVTVVVNGDTEDESSAENFYVNLTNIVGPATIADNIGVGYITDDDEPLPAITVDNIEVNEGNSGTVTATFTITLNKAGTESITVDYTTQDNSATDPEDYTAVNGTLTFAPGELTKTVDVDVIGDVDEESNHGFYLFLSDPVNAQIADAYGFCTINDDDAEVPAVRIYDAYVYEGNSGTAEMTFYIYLDKNPTTAVTLHYASADVTATDGEDYEAVSGDLTFSPGETYKSVTVTVNGDADFEGNEQFLINITDVENATVNDGQGSYIIYNDDNAVIAYVGDNYFNPEGDSGTKTLTFYVYLNNFPSKPVTLDYELLNGTATEGTDYVAGSGTLNYAVNEYYKTISITINGDEAFEPNEFFRIVLSNAENALIGDGEGILTIYDDDAPVQLYMSDNYVNPEGDDGSQSVTVYAYLTNYTDQTVTVDYTTTNGNATAGTDFEAASGTLTFSPGEYYKPIEIQVLGDQTLEPNEVFKITLSNPTNATIFDVNGVILIYDDDAVPYFSIGNASGNEGDNATFTISRNISTGTATVDYATFNGLATAPADYTATSGTVTFSNGEYYKFIDVPLATDALDEPFEYFFMRLSNPESGYTLHDMDGSAYINGSAIDYNYLGAYGTSDYEGDAGTKTFNFTVYLTRSGNNNEVTVNYAGRNISATSPSDYAPFSGTLTFAPNESSKTVAVAVNGDNAFEYDEAFGLTLTSPTNATLAEPSAVSNIYNDDNIAIMNVYDITIAEGNSGDDKTATVGVYLSPVNSDQTVTVNYTTQNGSALSGSDYTATNGMLTFSAADSYEEFTVTIAGDNTFEPDEYFRILLSSPTNAIIGDGDSYVKITDNDATPYLFVTDATVVEGDDGSPKLTFYVYLNVFTDKVVTVDYATEDVTTTSDDYTAINGTLTFDGVTSHTVELPVNPDLIFEPTEYVNLVLSTPVNANVGDGTGTGTITDDDNTPIANIYDSYVYEGNDGETDLYFGVYLNQYSDQTITIDYATANGTASSATDYTAVSGTLTFNPYQTYQYVLVKIQGDETDETNETFNVTLSNPENVLLGDNEATGTIYDDDAGASSFAPVAGNTTQLNNSNVPIANVFTPNGDGINDQFSIAGIENAENEVIVMNRQGVQLFKKHNYKNDWDASGVEDGTYFYLLKVRDENGKLQVKKGYVTVVRQLNK